MKQYLKFRSVYGESFSEIERITHTLESDGITPVPVLDYEGKPIMTRGNISMITGLSKIENSSFVKALAVSYFKGERGKLLRPFSSSSAMYIDSEKTAAELCTLSDDIRKCATEGTGNAPVVGLSMFKSADAETPESLFNLIERYAPELVFINDIAPYTGGKSYAEANDFIKKLHVFAEKADTHICFVYPSDPNVIVPGWDGCETVMTIVPF